MLALSIWFTLTTRARTAPGQSSGLDGDWYPAHAIDELEEAIDEIGIRFVSKYKVNFLLIAVVFWFFETNRVDSKFVKLLVKLFKISLNSHGLLK